MITYFYLGANYIPKIKIVILLSDILCNYEHGFRAELDPQVGTDQIR